MNPADIRKASRAARRALAPADRRRKSQAIAQRLASIPAFRSATRIALYASTVEEVDTTPVIRLCQQVGKAIYLPVVSACSWRPAPLLFRPYTPGITPLCRSAYGIAEPQGRLGTGLPGKALDLALVPLIAFNDQCERIGMGKGYYDRSFPKRRRPLARTTLVGLAFECQKARFAPAPHDTPLDLVLTEAATYSRRPAPPQGPRLSH